MCDPAGQSDETGYTFCSLDTYKTLLFLRRPGKAADKLKTPRIQFNTVSGAKLLPRYHPKFGSSLSPRQTSFKVPAHNAAAAADSNALCIEYGGSGMSYTLLRKHRVCISPRLSETSRKSLIPFKAFFLIKLFSIIINITESFVKLFQPEFFRRAEAGGSPVWNLTVRR
jgi:hypothetical protein